MEEAAVCGLAANIIVRHPFSSMRTDKKWSRGYERLLSETSDTYEFETLDCEVGLAPEILAVVDFAYTMYQH